MSEASKEENKAGTSALVSSLDHFVPLVCETLNVSLLTVYMYMY